jgi:folate-dependent phosphoribosylglycinamide formyltransferase PurN
MSPATVVLLSGSDAAGSVTYNFLSRELEVAQVLREQPVPKMELVRGRLRRFGLFTVLGQILFRLLVVPFLRLTSGSRIREIMREAGLNDAPPPPQKITGVESVNSDQTISLLRQLQPKVVVLAGTRILSPQVLECVPARFVNLHAGITPLYRGVHGAYWALVEGKPEACGVTVHLVDAGIDTGGILAQATIAPTPRDNFATYLWLQLAAGLPLLATAVRDAGEGRVSLQTPPAGPSKLWTHPTLTGYLWRRLRDGVR